MSSVDIPSIQTIFAPYSTSSRPYRSSSPGSPPPAMSYQNRSYSISSASSHLSTYSSSSDRSLSASPGPATPCDMMSRSPSFSHDSIYKPTLSSPSLSSSSSQRYTLPSISSARHHPYQTSPKLFQQSSYQDRQLPPLSQYSTSQYKALPSPSSPEMYSPRMNNTDYQSSLHHHHVQYPTHHYNHQGPKSPYSPSYYNSHTDYFQPRPSKYNSNYPVMITPKEEEIEPSTLGSRSSPLEEEDDERSDYSPSAMNSPSMSHTGSSFSRDSSPMNHDLLGSMSEASASMTSLISSGSSSSGSMTPVPTTTQLLLCPVCGRAFKPSKNQNCNLRRHLKNVHSMSPTMHPRKCKWDSLPDGRVKDDKDRKERTRKSKRLWARKFRQRRKVEEAAVVLSMLSQAV